MDPLRYCDDLPLPPKEEILYRLAGRAGRGPLLEILRLLCPCRNTCRDVEIWRTVLDLTRPPRRHHRREVREGARHAIASLRERARIDSQTYDLLIELGVGYGGQRRNEWRWADAARRPRIVKNDVPTLVEMLASEDPTENADALEALFGARGYHIAGSIWREFERFADGEDPRLRTNAALARKRIQEHRSAAA